jgi:hypothetical protein
MLMRTGNTIPRPLKTMSGASLARTLAFRHVDARSTLAAMWVNNELELVSPAITQAVPIFGVTPARISAALRWRKEYVETQAGVAEKIFAALAAPEVDTIPDLVRAFNNSSPAERIEAAKMIGSAVLWDELIAPVI